MSDPGMAQARGGAGGAEGETRPQGVHLPPQGESCLDNILKMDQLVRQADSRAEARDLCAHWTVLRENLFRSLVRTVDTQQRAPPAPVHPTNRTTKSWASVASDSGPQEKQVPKRFNREVFVSRRGTPNAPALTPAEATTKVNNVVKEWCKGSVVAARVLPSGDAVLVADTSEMATALKERTGWEASLGAGTVQKKTRFTVMVKHVARDALDCTNQEAARKGLLAQNERFNGLVEVIHIGRSARVGQQGKAGALLIDVSTPQQANLLIDEGVILQSVYHDVEVFDPECLVTRCYKCQGIGHTSRICRKELRCGFCAGRGHGDQNCEVRKGNGHATCPNCEERHPSWASSCGNFVRASEHAREAFKQRPSRFAVPQANRTKADLREEVDGVWYTATSHGKKRGARDTGPGISDPSQALVLSGSNAGGGIK